METGSAGVESLTPDSLALLLETRRDALFQTWAERVLSDAGLPAASKFSRPALHGHLRALMDRLVAGLRSPAVDPEVAGRLVGSSEEAQKHVQNRVQANYSAPEALRELSHLRLAVVDACRSSFPDGPSAATLHAAFDQLMIEAAEVLWQTAVDARRRAEELAFEQTALYQKERDARFACEEAHHAKDQFLAMASHELRTPLNAIAGWAQMLALPGVDPKMRGRGLASIRRNADVQARLLDGLLDISRLRAGRVSVQRAPVDVVALLRSVSESFTPAISEKKLRLELSLPIETTAVGEEASLRQVFTNLLGNAIKFTPKDGAVGLRVEGDSALVHVEVSDSGIGIPESFLPHVFEPFRQADASLGREHGGLGLGLAIAKAIVDLHGGTVEAVSGGPGRGATFRVTLPGITNKELTELDATGGAPAPAPRPSSLAPTLTAALVHGPNGAPAPRERASSSVGDTTGRSLFLVEDDAAVALELAELFREEGFSVRHASNGAQAWLELEDGFRPDVIVLDLVMPVMDGWTLRRMLLGEPRLASIPVVALTGASPSEVVTVERVDAIVRKPFDFHSLLRVVDRFARASLTESAP